MVLKGCVGSASAIFTEDMSGSWLHDSRFDGVA